MPAPLPEELRVKIRPLLGVLSDAEIARRFRIGQRTVYDYRRKAGVEGSPRPRALANGEAFRTFVLRVIGPKSRRSGEIYRDVLESWGRVSHRHVIRVLGQLVERGELTFDGKAYSRGRHNER